MDGAHLPGPVAGWHLAQLNIAVAREALHAPVMREFVALLAPVNALADDSTGFVWRLQTADGDATGIRGFDDERIIINLSVWTDPHSLWNFAYASGHLDVLRRRREWFQRLAEAHMVLWWIPEGALPTVAEAELRLAQLRRDGPGPEAFTFRSPFPPGAAGVTPADPNIASAGEVRPSRPHGRPAPSPSPTSR